MRRCSRRPTESGALIPSASIFAAVRFRAPLRPSSAAVSSTAVAHAASTSTGAPTRRRRRFPGACFGLPGRRLVTGRDGSRFVAAIFMLPAAVLTGSSSGPVGRDRAYRGLRNAGSRVRCYPLLGPDVSSTAVPESMSTTNTSASHASNIGEAVRRDSSAIASCRVRKRLVGQQAEPAVRMLAEKEERHGSPTSLIVQADQAHGCAYRLIVDSPHSGQPRESATSHLL